MSSLTSSKGIDGEKFCPGRNLFNLEAPPVIKQEGAEMVVVRRFCRLCYRAYGTAAKKAGDKKTALERWDELVTKELKGKRDPQSLIWKTPEVS